MSVDDRERFGAPPTRRCGWRRAHVLSSRLNPEHHTLRAEPCSEQARARGGGEGERERWFTSLVVPAAAMVEKEVERFAVDLENAGGGGADSIAGCVRVGVYGGVRVLSRQEEGKRCYKKWVGVRVYVRVRVHMRKCVSARASEREGGTCEKESMERYFFQHNGRSG
jgi:hypothetical protein